MEMMGKVLRSARMCLDLAAKDVAEAAHIGLRTLGRLEAGDAKISLAAFSDVRRTLEGEGITFLPEGKGHGPGFLSPATGYVGPLLKKQKLRQATEAAKPPKRAAKVVRGEGDRPTPSKSRPR